MSLLWNKIEQPNIYYELYCNSELIGIFNSVSKMRCAETGGVVTRLYDRDYMREMDRIAERDKTNITRQLLASANAFRVMSFAIYTILRPYPMGTEQLQAIVVGINVTWSLKNNGRSLFSEISILSDVSELKGEENQLTVPKMIIPF